MHIILIPFSIFCSDIPTYRGTVKILSESYNKIQVEFEPSRDPKQRIRGYEVENLATKETQFVRHSTFSVERFVKVTFVGLKPETHYEFRVRAVNPTGTGLWSPAAKALTIGMMECFFFFFFKFSVFPTVSGVLFECFTKNLIFF